MSEAAKLNGQPCARCGMKNGAHDWRNRHPKACAEWLTATELREAAADLREERERDRDELMHGWMLDPDMEAQG